MSRRRWRKKKRKPLDYKKYSIKRLTGIIATNEQKISALTPIKSANDDVKKRNAEASTRHCAELNPCLRERYVAEQRLKQLGFWKTLFSSGETEAIKSEIALLMERETQIRSRWPAPEKTLERWEEERLNADLKLCFEKISAAQQCLPQAQQLEAEAQRRVAEAALKKRAEKAGRLKREAEAALKKQAEKAERQKLRAMADAYVGKARKMADTVRRQLKRYDHCPYCFGPLGEIPHADHIHPVSAGGLSVEENMIFVCSVCNGNKSDLTLREFCSRFRLQRDRVEAVLIKLGKRV